MKAARLLGVGSIEVVEVDEPRPEDGESLVRVDAVGICGSDLHWYCEGGIGASSLVSPLILGHEFAGTVMGGPLDGRRVAVDPCMPCNTCRECDLGSGNLCSTARFAGHAATDGALRDYVSWPTHLLHPVPQDLSSAAAALLEPLGVALHAFDLSGVRAGDCAAIVGAGPIGLMLVQIARSYHLDPVYVLEPLDHRRSAALSYGADAFGSSDEFLAAVGANGAEVIFDAAGSSTAVDTAMRAARPGGRVVVIGIPSRDSTTFATSVARRKGLTVTFAQRMRDVYPRVVELLEKGAVEIDSMITARYPLERAHEAFASAAHRSGIKTIIAS